ncbi:SusC/RagA family TonB-linked outer membrane protein [Bacteroides heparinolyticus]|uniref:SusC/RagA family TonB-linked outer membrane protein n=1 Tax=Prevotella heparinolytica TaxID=28113 RepID=UPI0035A0924C
MVKQVKSVCVLLLALTVSSSVAYAATESENAHVQVVQQSGTCKGVVVDATGETVIGASVRVKGTTNGTITGLDGDFSLVGVKKGDVIQVSFVGYETQEVVWNGNSTPPLRIVLKDSSLTIDEVVITGYGGKQVRSKVTNSIAKVKDETLKQGLYSNPAQALSGAVAGLSVSQTSGNPGATPTIVLRGGTNFNGSGSPLILVDGQVRASLSDINPGDIESMEVLKDAGATAIYGARANDGVILITTKRGKAGKAEVNFSAKLGLNYYRDSYEFLGAEDYLYWMRMAYKRADTSGMKYPDGKPMVAYSDISTLKGATPYGTGNSYFAADGVTPLDGNKTSTAVWSPMIYTDKLSFLLDQGWRTMTDPVYGDKIIFKEHFMKDFNLKTPAMSQDYNINVNGGNEKGHYYAGLGYNKSDGTAYGNWYKRVSFVLNADYKLKPWLTSNSSFNFVDATWNGLPASQTNEENYFSRGFSVPSTFLGYNAAGEMLLGTNLGDGNQRYNFEKFVRDNNTDKFTLNQSFTIDFLKELSLKVGAIWYFSEEKYESFNKDYLSSPGNYNRSRGTSASYTRTKDETYNAVLNYNKQFLKDHSVDAMVGFEYYDSYTKGFSASGSGAPTDEFMDLEYTSKKENQRSIDSWHSRQRIMSFFGRLNYDFQSKYLFSFVIRKDGYSKLAKENRWGVFPGVSAGWVFSKEAFMKDFADILSFGKLRTSFGLNGNVNKDFVGYYTVQGSYTSNTYNGSTGFLLGSLPNPYLLWEKSRTFEVGLDLGFLENRINANLTYYNRLTSDKFANITLPTTAGVNSFTSNNGKFQNQGFEFELGFRVIDQKDWKWNINWNGALNINKVIQLPNNKLDRNRQNAYQVYTGKGSELMWVGGYQEGQRPGDLYAFVAEGIYRSQDEIPAGRIDVTSGGKALYGGVEGYNKLDASQKKTALPIQPGDVKWKDVNNDGQIDQYDLVKVGNMVPKWTGGINTTVSWKDLTLSARFDYALGFKAFDHRTQWFMGAGQGTYNTIVETKNTWTPENPNAKYPTYLWADQLGKRNYFRTSTLFVHNGDYLSIRELSLSYKLPTIWVQKAKLSRVDLSVTGQNLGYLTEAKHLFSPEKANSNGGYPLPRTIIFGVNVTF